MPLQDGAIYRTPDGRRLRAKSDTRRYHQDRGWTLVPLDAADQPATFTRDYLAAMLLLEGDRIYRFIFRDRPAIEDTGWTSADLIPEWDSLRSA
jgi:hypothetical protein